MAPAPLATPLPTPLPTPLAVVVLAHDRPATLHRLVAALDPYPVFLHVDAATDEATHAALTAGLPDRVRLLPRLRTGWASVGLVAAELTGYRAALEQTRAGHVALLSGTDYPIRSAADIAARLAQAGERSLVSFHDLPYARWGLLRGYDRFVFRQRPWRRHRLLSPVPRRWPADVRPAGGSQMKVLSRRHARRLVDALRTRADLRRYFEGVWIPDEVLVPSILTSPAFSPDWAGEVAAGEPWFMDWGEGAQQSPRWLGAADFAAIAAAAGRADGPLFARKFGADAGPLLDRIDIQLRGVDTQPRGVATELRETDRGGGVR